MPGETEVDGADDADTRGAGAAVTGVARRRVDPLVTPALELADAGRALGGGVAVGDRIGGLTVEGKLGEGGMGVVLAAHDPLLDRRVALKLVHAQVEGDESASQAQLRLLKEAQAMARISHPNVVSVHDVGTYRDQVFLSMEWIDGSTVERWAVGRPWREIVRVFLDAARGLLAAHRAGLIHRDFKPANLLVGKDGRARVCDFGLASVASDARAVAPIEAEAAELRATPVPLLTRQGAVLGTPAYMAPEQIRGGPPDPLSDQFAFCVSLWEVLYGARPFVGADIYELFAHVTAGELEPPSDRRRVPDRIHEVLVRGLDADPARRWPSLEALVGALERRMTGGRRRFGFAAAGLAALGLAGLSVVLLAGDRGAASCRRDPRALAGGWDVAAAAATRSAFATSGHPGAAPIFERAAAALDGYAAGWVEARQRACKGSWITGVHLLDRRMQCLDRHRAELAELVGFLRDRPGREGVASALEAIAGLAPISQCDDLLALLSEEPPARDPALRSQVDQLEHRLARSRVLHRAGKSDQAIELASSVVDDVRPLDHPGLLAHALYQFGSYQSRGGDIAAGEAALREALPLASRVGDDDLIAGITIELMWNLGDRQGKFDTALAVRTTAEAALARAGDPPRHRAEFYFTLGAIEHSRGLDKESRADYLRGLDIAEAKLPGELVTAELLEGLGMVAAAHAEYQEADGYYQKALAVWQQALGTDSLGSTNTLNSLGNLYSDQGDYDRAIEYYQRAFAIKKASHGEVNESVAMVLNNLGATYVSMGKVTEARDCYQRALAIWEKVLPADHPDLALVLHNLGAVTAQDGDYDAAIALFERALAISRAGRGEDHYLVGGHLLALGEAWTSRGDPDRGLPYIERAIPIMEHSLGARHPYLVTALTTLGKCQLARHRPAAAVAPLERALAIADDRAGDPVMTALTQFALARALWDSKRSRGRARKLAEAARAAWEKSPDRASDELAEVTEWLAARGAH